MAVSAKVSARITAQLKKYQSVLKSAQKRDVSEADTVTIITDILADIFGYDKYKEVSSEHAIRGTYVDLVVTVDEKETIPDRGEGDQHRIERRPCKTGCRLCSNATPHRSTGQPMRFLRFAKDRADAVPSPPAVTPAT